MIRICIALMFCLAAASSAVAADRWAFNEAARAAGITNGGGTLVVTCANGGIGFIYQVRKSAIPSNVRGKRAVFTLSDSSGQIGIEGAALNSSGSKVYVAFSGSAASQLAQRVAKAPATVSAGLALPRRGGLDAFAVTKFSAAGSGAAIRSAIAACKR